MNEGRTSQPKIVLGGDIFAMKMTSAERGKSVQ